jgi:ribosome modulation factor
MSWGAITARMTHRDTLSAGHISEYFEDDRPERTKRHKRGRVDMTRDRCLKAGRRAFERGDSRDKCTYSDPNNLNVWLEGYDAAQREKNGN